MGFSLKKAFKKVTKAAKDTAGVVFNPAKQLAIVDSVATGGKLTAKVDEATQGKFGEYASLKFGDPKQLQFALPVLSKATTGMDLGGGQNMDFLKDLNKNFGLDFGKIANSFLGGSPSGATAPASAVVGRPVSYSAPASGGDNKMMMYIGGGVAALILVVLLVKK